VVKILKGKKPSEIAIEKDHELVNAFNVVTARRLGVEISPALMLNANIVGDEKNEEKAPS